MKVYGLKNSTDPLFVCTYAILFSSIGDCEDDHIGCPGWAARGECDDDHIGYAAMIQRECRKSCNTCGVEKGMSIRFMVYRR